VLSAISSTPECEKCVKTLAKLSRAIVSSEMIISENAEKVLEGISESSAISRL